MGGHELGRKMAAGEDGLGWGVEVPGRVVVARELDLFLARAGGRVQRAVAVCAWLGDDGVLVRVVACLTERLLCGCG